MLSIGPANGARLFTFYLIYELNEESAGIIPGEDQTAQAEMRSKVKHATADDPVPDRKTALGRSTHPSMGEEKIGCCKINTGRVDDD